MAVSAAFSAPPAHPHKCQATSRDRAFVSRVWDHDRWRRGSPKQTTIAAWRRSHPCRELRQAWRLDRRSFNAYRKRRLVTPYFGGGRWWALPYYIVHCESGADYHVGFAGAYGLLTATWQYWGGTALGPWGTAGEAPGWAQDIVAHRVWTEVGPVGWECA